MHRAVCLLARGAALASMAAGILAQGQRPPSRSETAKLLRAYVAADGRTSAGLEERAAILTLIELLPPLRAREVESWKKRLLDEERKGRRLERSGRNWFWEDKRRREQRGLYIVGGETRRPKGLLIGLHGGGAGSGSADSAHSAYSGAAKRLGWVSICPQVLALTEHGWTDSGTEEFVLDLLDAALRTWNLDPNRVYFSGHSMGGYGSWTLGAHHADRVAALAPSAGAPTPILNPADDSVDGIVEGIIPNLRNVAMIIYQSIDDPKVPPQPNQFAVKLMGEAKDRWGGYDFEYWEVDGRGHSLPVGGALALLEGFRDRVREPVPERVVWQPTLNWKRQFYWLYWDRPDPRAIVVADLDRGANAVRLQCDVNCDGLQVLLDERMVNLDEEVVVFLNDAEVFRGVPERTLSTLFLTTSSDPELFFTARVPVTSGG